MVFNVATRKSSYFIRLQVRLCTLALSLTGCCKAFLEQICRLWMKLKAIAT